MTLKLKKTELFKAFMIVLCALAVACAVIFVPRGTVSAEEPEVEATYTVTWECKTNADTDNVDEDADDETAIADEWVSFQNGNVLFTYEEGVDYGDRVRAKIEIGADGAVYVYSDDADMHLTYSGTFEGEDVNALVNATEYTITIDGAPDVIAAVDKTIKIKIAPREFDLSESDFVDYYGEDGDPNKLPNRLWVLDDGNATELGDCVTYYDPDAEFSTEYGAKVTTGVLYNSYVRYTGEEQTITLNGDYEKNGKTLNDYVSAVKSIVYANTPETPVGTANTVNQITTTATITLNGNWVLDNGEKTVVLTKDWYIVTVPNALRTLDGDKNTAVAGWTYGSEIPELDVRPEHGDIALLTLKKISGNANADIVLARFAALYSVVGEELVIKYYDVKTEDGDYVIDTENELDDDYYAQQLGALKVGAYTLDVSVPAHISTDDHLHWWDNAEPEVTGVVYCPISVAYSFSVASYELTADNVGIGEADGKDVVIKLVTEYVEYNGLDSNVPAVTVTFRGVELVYDVDYELTSSSKNVGKASLTFVGKGSFAGSVPFDEVYNIVPAVNSWKDVPSIMYWTYGNYDKQMNLINGTPTYLDNPNDISFKVTVDMLGETPAADALASFLLTDGIVSDDVAQSLSALPVGTYYLFASVKGSTNYKPLIQRGVAFKVFPATNSWEVTPAIVAWTEGKFKSINLPVAKALYGNATIVIKDGNGKDVYNNVTGVNKLSEVEAGTYTLTATVMGSNDYDGLVYSTVFIVHEKPGIPVWATILIVLGCLLLIAAIVFTLIKTGVLRILTDKLMVKIRTQAAVDATVAAVRANERNYEYKQQVNEAKEKKEAEALRKEKREARKAKAAQEKALPLEQKIAALEEKARKANARAEKMKERADAIQQRADRMREATAEPQPTPEQTEQPATEPTAEAAATDNGTATED